MKSESVLNVLMYIFKNYMNESICLTENHPSLTKALEAKGFPRKVILDAFKWLDSLSRQSLRATEVQTGNSIRVYNEDECALFNVECRGFINFLETHGILKPYTREMVINLAIALKEEFIDVYLIKWVTLMVLFSLPEEKSALTNMELLVLEDPAGALLH